MTPQSVICFEGYGMPCAETGDIVMDTKTALNICEDKAKPPRGNLLIKFNIVFPKKILTHHRAAMLAALEANSSFKA